MCWFKNAVMEWTKTHRHEDIAQRFFDLTLCEDEVREQLGVWCGECAESFAGLDHADDVEVFVVWDQASGDQVNAFGLDVE